MPKKYSLMKEKILAWLDDVLKNIWKEGVVEVVLTETDNKHVEFIEKTVETEIAERGLFCHTWYNDKKVHLRVTTEETGWPR